MDSDEFDDDILDEDLIIAASQVPSRINSTNSTKRTAARHSRPHVSHSATRVGQSHNSRQTTAAAWANSSASNIVDLDDLPDDAFSSSPYGGPSAQLPSRDASSVPRVGGPIQAYRQTTLFGDTVRHDRGAEPVQRVNSNVMFRADLPVEAATHHEIDREAMRTWVYPTNLGAIRDYQYTIVKQGLFNNTLVALPTGLGKTFIAATIMLNFFRWTKTAKIIFVAPTKPLVSQQVDACFNIAGIPRSQTTLLTGEIPPPLRAEEWETKRVFFMTPQTLENDLSSGIADPKSIGLLVVDEAHRATGNYAYVKVVTFIRRFSSSFRVLALTATPGSKVEAVQEVIDSLGISQVEIRTEASLDIVAFVHQRQEDIELLDPSEEMVLIKDLFSKALKPLVDKLSSQNIYYGRDPMSLTTYGLMQARKDWFGRAGQHANQGIKFMMMAIFAILQSLAHSIKLLNFHGIKPFYDNLLQFRDETEGKGEKGSKFKRQLIESPDFQKMMSTIGGWAKKDDFVSHPKLTALSGTVLNHFIDAGEGREGGESSNTRIIVFSEYRDSAEEIVRVLNRHKPMIRAAVFVGQADTKKSEGMKQSEQIERIKKFKEGAFNVLVATSIGEEGLDIGQVDLIVCYDASASPIRMLQRMGRTGRKRAGRVVLLLMRGKEEDNYAKSKDGYDKMQSMICNGTRFAFRHDLSTRIVPREIKPEVDKRHVEIPIENTQNPALPEPKKRAARKKKPPKKFHMPDGVTTGFASVASLLGKRPGESSKASAPSNPREEDEVTGIPDLAKVMLNSQQNNELERAYLNLPFYQHRVEEVQTVDLTANPVAQRTLRKTVLLKHGEHTKRCVKLFRTLSRSQSTSERHHRPYGESDQSRYDRLSVLSEISDSEAEIGDIAPPPRKKQRTRSLSDNDELEEITAIRARKPQRKAPQPNRPRAGHEKRRLSYPGNPLEEEEEEDSEADGARSPVQRTKSSKPKAPKSKAAPAKRCRPSKKQRSHIYDESADEGDDCRRTSDLELTDESDGGSDLVGFVVGDDVATSSAPPTSSMRHLPTSPTTPSTSSTVGPGGGRHKPYYEPTQFTATQYSDDDMPPMSQIVGKKQKTSKKSAVEVSEDEDEDEIVRRQGRGTKRRVVLDDDDEPDD
ncbi:type III restriction enzyme [Xylariales sp. AK1849]|nr:type III restriction enzyme [Xylariales sp. AK1849]